MPNVLNLGHVILKFSFFLKSFLLQNLVTGNYCYYTSLSQAYNVTWDVAQNQCQSFLGNLLQFTSSTAFTQFQTDGISLMAAGEYAYIGKTQKAKNKSFKVFMNI